MEAASQAFKMYGKYDLFLKWLHIFPFPFCLLATEQNNRQNWLLNFDKFNYSDLCSTSIAVCA